MAKMVNVSLIQRVEILENDSLTFQAGPAAPTDEAGRDTRDDSDNAIRQKMNIYMFCNKRKPSQYVQDVESVSNHLSSLE